MPVNIKKLLASPVLFGSVFAMEVSPVRRIYQQDLRKGSVASLHLKVSAQFLNAQILSAYLRNKYGPVLPGDLVAGPSLVHLAFTMEGFPCRVMEDR